VAKKKTETLEEERKRRWALLRERRELDGWKRRQGIEQKSEEALREEALREAEEEGRRDRGEVAGRIKKARGSLKLIISNRLARGRRIGREAKLQKQRAAKAQLERAISDLFNSAEAGSRYQTNEEKAQFVFDRVGKALGYSASTVLKFTKAESSKRTKAKR
jgi:hypothetical protein